LLLAVCILATLGLTGCKKEPVEVTAPPATPAPTAAPTATPEPADTKTPVADFTAVYKVPATAYPHRWRSR
jgi:hypothetical protein